MRRFLSCRSECQDFEAQVEWLKAAGCDRVYSEKASGKSRNGRHALDKAIRALLPGDTLVTVRLDRLARSIRDLLGLLDTIKAAGAYIKACREEHRFFPRTIYS
jgi:DNA invertase Pin-like site-specific DNA recombinase